MNNVDYDSAGNQTQLSLTAGTTAFYDAESRLAKVDAGGNTLVTYEYDGEGRRVKRIVGAATTYYVYDADGQLMAEYGSTVASTTTLYPVTDYLGSKRMVLDAQGGCKERIDYAPFGAQVMRTGQDCYSGSTNTDMPLFTGTMREDQTKADTQTGLDHMEARQYWASLGRFTSPDEPLSDQDTADPQSWNLYSYVRNNPLRFKDPTGLVCVVDPETGEEHNDDNPGQSCEDAHRDPLGGQIAVDEQGFAITLIGGIIYEVDEEGDRFPIAERSLQDTSLDVFATMRLAKAALGSVVREAPYLLADETGTFGGGGGWRSLANKVRLPTRGRFRFIHQKGRSAAQGFVRTSEGGFVDRFGNVWIRPKVPGATADEIHWGVQLSPAGKASWGRFSNSGSHVNVTVDGRITH